MANYEVAKGIIYAGVNDHNVDLFEGQYPVPNGISYNSYVIIDEKTAVMDTVDARFTDEWLDNVAQALGGRQPDYLVIQHMEPDHSANIFNFMSTYPKTTIVSSQKAFQYMANFFGTDFADRRIVVAEGDTLTLGADHTLAFVAAPMVHWPEVIVTYDVPQKVLFSADGFGKFGAQDREEEWIDESRRYFIGIVGKYGAQVQALLKKAATLDIQKICPLHGPVLTENLGYYINLYDLWSSYTPESEGIFVAYTSIYGNTKKAVELLVEKLKAKGCPKVEVMDLARTNVSYAVAKAFQYGKLVLATTTYNAEIFPYMKDFINHLTERNFQNRTVALVENGTWAPMAAKVMRDMFAKSKNINFTETTVTVNSALSDTSREAIEKLTDELCSSYPGKDNSVTTDPAALFKIGYGLYVVTSRDGDKDNGLILNSITQVTNSPDRIAVTVNKQNYSHHIIKKTGVMNVNCLSIDTPFNVFERFGFQSGRNADKFAGLDFYRTKDGLPYLASHINSYIVLKVENYLDLDTHGMFICSVVESKVVNNLETMTYSYYQENVKPKPETKGKKGWVCKICGYVHEEEDLPADFICPLCKHGAADFERIG